MQIDDIFVHLIEAFMAKDLDAVMAQFADDAVLIDPHYPQHRMVGREAIERGVRWGLSSLEEAGFALRNSAIHGGIGFFEVQTKHRLKIGITVQFDQVFVVEMRNGKITRLQAYGPYPAPGVAGLIRRATRLVWRLKGWL